MCARQSCTPFPPSAPPVCISASSLHRLLPDTVKVVCDLSCQSTGQFLFYSTSQQDLTQLPTPSASKHFLHLLFGTPKAGGACMSVTEVLRHAVWQGGTSLGDGHPKGRSPNLRENKTLQVHFVHKAYCPGDHNLLLLLATILK